MKKRKIYKISNEVLAAYLDGNATASECKEIIEALAYDDELREFLSISQYVDADMGHMTNEIDFLPITAMAATYDNRNLCCIECEKYILKRRKIDFDENDLLNNAINNKWHKDTGTELYNIGRNLEHFDLVVTRHFNCSISDIIRAVDRDEDVIAAIDGGELLGDLEEELKEDCLIGEIPDHTVVVLSYDSKNGNIVLFDPNSTNERDIYPIEQFKDAWADSKNYLVTVSSKENAEYNPRPIDLSDVHLGDELNGLREAIAENAHEIWAKTRKDDGWTYGPQRNDKLKQTPDMIPYSQLPDSEKKYDREMAMNTIKLLKKIGYDLIEHKDNELYDVLKKRISNASDECRCPKCNCVVSSDQKFCDNCGYKLHK